MDWNAAIDKNREALKRILAMLVTMAGLDSRGQFTFFPQDGALSQGLVLAEKLSPAPTLPRRLHRAVLALLRPAEAAARRLVIVAARGLVVPLPPARQHLVVPKSSLIVVHTRPDTGMLVPRHLLAQAGPSRPAPRRLSLPLFDRLPRWGARPRPVVRSVPRISMPGESVPFPIPAPPSPNDPVDTRRLLMRFEALGRVLDDLPREARRFARWRASRDAANAQITRQLAAAGVQIPVALYGAGAQNRKTRRRRVGPLRPGRPPGWRRKPIHEVHDILNVTHGLAIWAMERPDTS